TTSSAANSTTVAISWGSKRAIHRSALRQGKALSAVPATRSSATLRSVTLFRTRFSYGADAAPHLKIAIQPARANAGQTFVPATLVVLREACQSSRGARRVNSAGPVNLIIPPGYHRDAARRSHRGSATI